MNGKEITIQIYETSLPEIGTIYPIAGWWDSKPGRASIRLIDFYSYNATAGELYLFYKNGQWMVEICSVSLQGTSHTSELSGRILCNW